MTILTITAAAITPPSKGFAKTSVVATPISVATVTPLSSATRNSRSKIRPVLARVSWLVASARTATAIVWVPALPPIEATIGESAASATSFSIAPPKLEMIVAPSSAVTRLAISQRTRLI